MAATRRLAAILAADAVGYSRLIGADEPGTLQRLKAIRAELIDPAVERHNGRIVKTTGDSQPGACSRERTTPACPRGRTRAAAVDCRPAFRQPGERPGAGI